MKLFNGNGILTREYVLANCSLSGEFIFPDGVTVIGKNAFLGQERRHEQTGNRSRIWDEQISCCQNMKKIVIPEGVEVIGESAFSYCKSLEEVTLPKSLKRLESHAFSEGVSLREIALPEGLEVLGGNAFSGCEKLTAVTIPEKIKRLNPFVFWHCSSLKEVILPEGIEIIGHCAFSSCHSLKNIILPQTLTVIGESAFWDCTDLTDIDIPENVNYIGMSAFACCENLESVAIPDNIELIEYGTFRWCGKLKSVKLPKNLKMIDANAFADCYHLKLEVPNEIINLGNGGSVLDAIVVRRESGLKTYAERVSPYAVGMDVIVARPDIADLFNAKKAADEPRKVYAFCKRTQITEVTETRGVTSGDNREFISVRVDDCVSEGSVRIYTKDLPIEAPPPRRFPLFDENGRAVYRFGHFSAIGYDEEDLKRDILYWSRVVGRNFPPDDMVIEAELIFGDEWPDGYGEEPELPPVKMRKVNPIPEPEFRNNLSTGAVKFTGGKEKWEQSPSGIWIPASKDNKTHI